MTKRELIDYCLTYPGVYEDYPFDEEWAAIRHSANKKAFAFIYRRNGQLCLNLKCDPMQGDFWCSVFPEVGPAYHMNKTHWNTVIPGSTLPPEELYAMIAHSHSLTKPSKSRKKPD